MEDAKKAVGNLRNVYKARSEWEADLIKQYTSDYWNSDIGQEMKKSADGLERTIIKI